MISNIYNRIKFSRLSLVLLTAAIVIIAIFYFVFQSKKAKIREVNISDPASLTWLIENVALALTNSETELSKFGRSKCIKSNCNKEGATNHIKAKIAVGQLVWQGLSALSAYNITKHDKWKRYLETTIDQLDSLTISNNLHQSSPATRYRLGIGLVQLSSVFEAGIQQEKIDKLRNLGGKELVYQLGINLNTLHKVGNTVPMITAVAARNLARYGRLKSKDSRLSKSLPLNQDFYSSDPVTEYETASINNIVTSAIDRAVSNFNIMKNKGFVSENSFNKCWIDLAKIELSFLSNNQKDFEAISAEFMSRFNSWQISSLPTKLILTDLPSCIEVMQIICDSSPASRACFARDELINLIISAGWDNPSKPICDGDGAFISALELENASSNLRNCIKNEKSVANSAHLSWLISRKTQEMLGTYSN